VTRWHCVKAGRIVASVDAGDGDEAERLLAPDTRSWLVSDTDWRALHYKRRLRDYPHTKGA
jgi:hypothetical protein